MNLVQFIDNRFQELRLLEQEESKNQAYSLGRDAEVLALQSLLKGYRTLVKWLMVPKVMTDYVLVLVGYKKKPEPVLINKLKEDQAKKAEEKAVLDKLKSVPAIEHS